ncbi:MAG: DUF3138 family protein [Pseudomonadota bacterium]
MGVLKKTAVAVALAFPTIVFAQSNDDIRRELEALKQKVKQLEAAVDKKADSSADADARAEFNRTKVKVEAMEDQAEANGVKDLKISGYMDPSYIYNRNANTRSFAFLNYNGGTDTTGQAFTYDNDYFGDVVIRFEKELEGGTQWTLELMPHKGYQTGYNFPSIVNQAFVSIPTVNLQTRLLIGQIGSWPGYEYQMATAKKTITNNLLFDFTEPTFVTGAGLTFNYGHWDFKTIVGNLNSPRYASNQRSPVFHYRADYWFTEYSGFGFSGVEGKAPNNTDNTLNGTNSISRLDYFEVDGYYTRGDLTLQGQLDFGRQRKAAFNGGDAKWKGFSGLIANKFSPRIEGVLRYDYLDNSKNGGGLPAVFSPGTELADGTPCVDANANSVLCPDSANGFGPAVDSAGLVSDPNRGVKRQSLTLGLNYNFTQNTVFKFELRGDRADQAVFLDTRNNTFRKDNIIFGTSAVVSW